jgi:hypothetical protein
MRKSPVGSVASISNTLGSMTQLGTESHQIRLKAWVLEENPKEEANALMNFL